MLGVITAITGREMCEFAVISEYNLAVFIALSWWHTENMPQFAFRHLHLTDKQVAWIFYIFFKFTLKLKGEPGICYSPERNCEHILVLFVKNAKLSPFYATAWTDATKRGPKIIIIIFFAAIPGQGLDFVFFKNLDWQHFWHPPDSKVSLINTNAPYFKPFGLEEVQRRA